MSTSRAAPRVPTPGSRSRGGSWISKTPGVCGGDARIRDTRVTVWGLVDARRLGGSDSHLLEQTEGLRPDDLAAAWEYAAANPEEIERAIRENQEA